MMGHIAHVGKQEIHMKFLLKNIKGGRHYFGDLFHKILKEIFRGIYCEAVLFEILRSNQLAR
jgi:hypothetical protein